MALLNINVADLPVSEANFEPLPAGWYSASIAGAEIKITKAGGQMLSVKYSIVGPTHQGRMVFGGLNIKNSNPEGERIGRQQLGDLLRAIGLAKVDDTDQLIGHSLNIKLRIRPSKDGYEANNDVSGYKATEGKMPAVQASDSPFAGATTKAAPPWVKK